MFARIAKWLRPNAPLSKIVIATADYETKFIREDGNKTGVTASHVVAFMVDGEGKRFHSIDSGSPDAAERHAGLVKHAAHWKHHGDLPDHARRVIARNNIQPIRIVPANDHTAA